MFKRYLIAVGLLAAASPVSARAEFSPHQPPVVASASLGVGESLGFSPFWDWKQIETDHFRVVFPAELESAGRKFSDALEEAHRVLAPRMRWTPRHKTQIIVIDNADSANGLASPVQRLGIVLQATPPDNWFSIGHYDDWIRMLAFHEYTHILNMDVTDSWVYDLSRVLFGDLILPNSVWPTWMLEGLAVYMETRLTQGGRGKSPFYEMILRSAVADGVLDDPSFVTLDEINGPHPFYPGGETAYLFGYQLWNEVARNAKQGDAALGEVSLASGGRVPYFINGNLANITGKDWYQTWGDWVSETRKRIAIDLTRLHSQPLTPVERLTSSGYSVLGNAPSPDGNWIAYTQESLDRRSGLYLRDLRSGETRRIGDKSMGVGLAFTPDSRYLVFSGLRRDGLYSIWSELGSYDLKQDRLTWITSGLRGRDPDVAPDGKQVVFTQTDLGTTGLSIAVLDIGKSELALGSIKRIFWPNEFDRVSNPRFTPDGKHIVFSVHSNGAAQEDLMELDLSSGKTRSLLQDGWFNRFPAIDSKGHVYFVSNRTGVDNLFRLAGSGVPEQVSNTLTGIWLPSFGPHDQLYASHYSSSGWDLARITPTTTALPSTALTIEGPPAPSPKAGEIRPATASPHEVSDYSPWHSLLPRQWAPALYATTSGKLGFGGEVFGFDAVDRHRYLFGALYDPDLRRPDWVALYSNRSLGPSINLLTTGHFSLFSNSYRREETRLSVSADFPFHFTYSTITPSVGFNTERDALVSIDGSRATYYPNYEASTDLRVRFSNVERSRLAITAEGGRSTEIGLRRYFREGTDVWKVLLSDTENLRITDHSILSPRVAASWSSHTSRTGSGVSNVRVEGEDSSLLGSGHDLLDELPLRGYPNILIQSRFAATGALDFRFPLARIFRGWGTNPFFIENLSGFLFGETAYFRTKLLGSNFMPAAGAGMRLDLDALVHVPVEATLEYRKGFREEVGGTGEVRVSLGLGAFAF